MTLSLTRKDPLSSLTAEHHSALLHVTQGHQQWKPVSLVSCHLLLHCSPVIPTEMRPVGKGAGLVPTLSSMSSALHIAPFEVIIATPFGSERASTSPYCRSSSSIDLHNSDLSPLFASSSFHSSLLTLKLRTIQSLSLDSPHPPFVSSRGKIRATDSLNRRSLSLVTPWRALPI